MIPLPDQIRDIPEFAVRMYLGADCLKENGHYILKLDDEKFTVPPEIFDRAAGVAKALAVRLDRRVETAGDILNLRHAAESIFLNDFLSAKGLPKILFCPVGEIANAWYRAMIPARVMSDAGLAVAHHTHLPDLKKILNYDIFWIQLDSSPAIYQLASAAKDAGIKIVYDIDDRFDCIPEDNPASRLYKGEKLNQIQRIIKLADYVTVSTVQLGRSLSSFGAKRIGVLPNMIPAGLWPNPAPVEKDPFRILWAGSPTHRADLAIAAPAIRKILEEGDGSVRFTCFGENIPEDLISVKRFVDLIPFVDFEQYPEKLLGIGAHIAIAPLQDNPFNSSKSAVKFIEYSNCGYPSLLSPVGEYKDIVNKENAPALLVKDDEWESSIRSAMFSRSTFQEMGNQAKDWVRENRCIIKHQAKPWVEAAKILVPK